MSIDQVSSLEPRKSAHSLSIQSGGRSREPLLLALTTAACGIFILTMVVIFWPSSEPKLGSQLLDFSGRCKVVQCSDDTSIDGSNCFKTLTAETDMMGPTPFKKVKVPHVSHRFDESFRDVIMNVKLGQVFSSTLCPVDQECNLQLRSKTSVPSLGPGKCVNGVVHGFPCQHVHLLSLVTMEDLCRLVEESRPSGWEKVTMAKVSSDMWAWHDEADDYVLIGTNWGTSFVRVTDPEHPEVLAFLPTRGRPSYHDFWKDMKVVNNHAFIGSEKRGHGVQIVDLTLLRDLTSNTSRLLNDSDIIYYEGVGNSHNIIANTKNNRIFIVGATKMNNSGRVYNTCNKGGLHILDVTNPKKPEFLGCVTQDGYTHDAQCVIYKGPDKNFISREICLCYNEDSFTIVDTTNASDPVILSRYGYTGVSYTHQGWASENFTLNFLDDEFDEYDAESKDGKRTRTYIWDITDLTRPDLISVFISNETAIDHNLYIKGNFIYQANYEAGLRILEIDFNSCSLTEVAHFDAFPDSTEAEFHGVWSNYPWLKSNDTVALSSMEHGLFLLRVDFEAITAEKNQRKKK